MNTGLRFLGIVALSAALCACPESIHPASDPARAAPDAALFGVWHGSFEGDEMYLHVAAAERGMTGATVVTHEKKGRLKTERYVAFPTPLGKLAVLNVRQIDEGGNPRGYSLFKYQVDKRRLTLWLTSYGAVRDDITAGRLQGKAEPGPHGETLITASTEALAAYLVESEASRLFDKPLVFQRVDRR